MAALMPSNLVLALRLDTEFLDRCVRHSGSNETWDIGESLGKGGGGTVRIDRRRAPPTAWGTQHGQAASGPLVRAVKEVAKENLLGIRWDYMKELEAIARFSRDVPHFVRTYGWFEDSKSIFITMEYFALGDLRRSMNESPPFREAPASQIVKQLVEGVGFMHQSRFAHRDLKPANILVAQRHPKWIIKIADFGISKGLEGTDMRTARGTEGYMAPEVLGWAPDAHSGLASGAPGTAAAAAGHYTVAVDMWAIGVITAELLLKRNPFPSCYQIFQYAEGKVPLNLDGGAAGILSDACRDFVGGLLAPHPTTRPTAVAALAHQWLAAPDQGGHPQEEEDESMFVDDYEQPVGIIAMSPPSLAWSNQPPATNSSTLMTTYQGPRFDMSILVPSFRVLSIDTTRFFVLRSDNPLDIETSAAHGVWTSSTRVNKILDKGYARAQGNVVLFFSVIKSKKFCGVAKMTSPMDWENTDGHWLEDNWRGRFTLDWLCLTELPFQGVKRIPVKEHTPGFRAISCFDGQEIAATSAYELLRAFSAEEREQQARLQGVVTPPVSM